MVPTDRFVEVTLGPEAEEKAGLNQPCAFMSIDLGEQSQEPPEIIVMHESSGIHRGLEGNSVQAEPCLINNKVYCSVVPRVLKRVQFIAVETPMT